MQIAVAILLFYYLNNGKSGFLKPIVEHDKRLFYGEKSLRKFPSKAIIKGFFGRAGL